MSDKIIASIPGMSDQELDQLELNVLERRHGPKAADAELILTAIIAERSARKSKALAARESALNQIRERMAGMSMQQRVEAAFSEAPPEQFVRAMLNTLAANPGATTEELSNKLGYSDTYMNWFGIACFDRQPWLGSATPRPDGKLIYSDLLCDFETVSDLATGKAATRWWLKDDALRGLRRLRIVK